MDIKTLIKNALKGAGLPEAWLSSVKADKEEDVQPAVDGLKTLINNLKETGKADFAALMRDVGLEDQFNAHVQSTSDKRVTEALKTHEAKIRKELLAKLGIEDPAKGDAGDTGKKDSGKSDTQEAILAAVKSVVGEIVKPIQDTVEALKKEKEETGRGQLINAALKEHELDPKYAKYVTGKTEDEIKKSVLEVKQDLVDKAVEGNGTRAGKGDLTATGDKIAEELAKEANTGTTDGAFVGVNQSKSKGKGES